MREFYGAAELVVPGFANLSVVSSTSQSTERSSANIRSDPNDYLLLALQRSGNGFVEQEDRRTETGPGEFVLYETGKPYRLFFDGPFEQMVFRVPRSVVALRLRRVSSLTARRFDGTTGAGAIVASYMQQLSKHGCELGAVGLQSLEAIGAELVAAALGTLDDGASPDDAIFGRIVVALEKHLGNPDLDIEKFANGEGMSLRTFQRLFHARGLTPRGWVLDRRLRGVAAILASPASARRSITDIALAGGFNDLTHFNRCFRAKYSMTPSLWRIKNDKQLI